MHGSLHAGRKAAIKPNGKSAADKFSDGKSAVDDGEWFSRAARLLYPHKPGTTLHLITGLGDERLCQRCASGEVRPTAYFLRALLRGPHGERWFAILMENADSPWWQQLQRARRIAGAIDAAG